MGREGFGVDGLRGEEADESAAQGFFDGAEANEAEQHGEEEFRESDEGDLDAVVGGMKIQPVVAADDDEHVGHVEREGGFSEQDRGAVGEEAVGPRAAGVGTVEKQEDDG